MINGCPVCRERDLNSLGMKNGIPIMICKKCTHVFADLEKFDFNHEDLNDFREGFTHGLMRTDREYYDHLVRGEAPGLPTHITATRLLAMIQSAGFKNGRWLDIGSGSGYLVKHALESGFDVSGIEPGGWGQIAAKLKKIEIVQGFLEENLSGAKYSIVSATDVVEHIPEPVFFLKLMSGYLKSGGVIVISVPCYDSFEAKVLGLNWPMMAPPTHRHFFTKKSLAIAMARSGMRPLEMQQFNIRRLLGLSRYGFIRRVIDSLVSGDQLICMAMLEEKNEY